MTKVFLLRTAFCGWQTRAHLNKADFFAASAWRTKLSALLAVVMLLAYQLELVHCKNAAAASKSYYCRMLRVPAAAALASILVFCCSLQECLLQRELWYFLRGVRRPHNSWQTQ